MTATKDRAIARTAALETGEVSYWEYPAQEPGAGTDLLFIHGFRGDHHGLELLAAALPGHRIIAPDLPGFGVCAPFASREHSVENYAGFVHDFAAALQLGPDAVLLGHSFGSIIAAHYLAAQPASFAAAVLVNPISEPALKGPRAVASRLAELYYFLGARLPERAGLQLLKHPAIVRVMSMMMAKTRDPQLRRFIHAQHDAYFSAFANRSVVLESFRASISHDVLEAAPALSLPVLLIAGAKDDLGSVASQQNLAAAMPDAQLEIIDGVGHLIHYEAPEAAAGMVSRFLAERAL
ncbi:alpha/beta hydrolase fold protein [Arthrobacter crystallopoietes BAB-32]|uniref:Alpha/beta hydrolase fold protein n=1 Tax=Arthrobacter crystallopoietes BAB-32 TaxID=1246476 RepID=N1UZ73_9MICC|nr:alpha/beta hydrolase [Arthrobacter crystallopoietes]EMY33132.1 alpha/beta hydrolase fold protein [Arthrobacter crystallopoietes BAB-32]